MFGFNQKRAAQLGKRITQLEDRCLVLTKVRDNLQDENAKLGSENEELRQKKQMDEEMIAHKLKMREESVALDADKRVSAAERKAAREKDDGIAKVKDKYRDKLENQLEKRGDEMKAMYGQILKRLPDVSMAITKEIKEIKEKK